MNVIDRAVFGIRAYNGQNALKILLRCFIWKKELFVTNNYIPISLNVNFI